MTRTVERALLGVAKQAGDLAEVQSRFGEVSRRLGVAFPVDDVLAAHAFDGQPSLQSPWMHCQFVRDGVGTALAGGARGGGPASRWRSLTDALVARIGIDEVVQTETLRSVLRLLDVDSTVGEWRANLRHLGVLTADERLVSARLDDVATALGLVGDSFAAHGPVSSWAPVATLPPELRALLRPPPLRHTAGVLLELVDRARRELLVTAPFVDPHAVDFLADALVSAGRRGAETRIVTSVGQSASFHELARRWGTDAHATLRVTEVHTQLSSLGSHAKVLVVDGERGYVGSANLTAPGLGRHIELGVELSGAQVTELAKVLVALERIGTRVITVSAAMP